MENRGTSIILFNEKKEILMLLRDNISGIDYPNCWDLIGGHFENNESPKECIVREVKEELGIDVFDSELFKETNFNGKIEHTFWKKVDFKTEEINLTEGQKIEWFSEEKIIEIPENKIAFGFKPIILDFFRENLHKKQTYE